MHLPSSRSTDDASDFFDAQLAPSSDAVPAVQMRAHESVRAQQHEEQRQQKERFAAIPTAPQTPSGGADVSDAVVPAIASAKPPPSIAERPEGEDLSHGQRAEPPSGQLLLDGSNIPNFATDENIDPTLLIKNLDTGEAFSVDQGERLNDLVGGLTVGIDGVSGGGDDDSDSEGEENDEGVTRLGKGWRGRMKHLTKLATKQMAQQTQDRGNIKVKLRKKDPASRELERLFLCQRISFHKGPIWTMKFSPDGLYLATAGQDTRVIVWKVRRKAGGASGQTESGAGGDGNANEGSSSERGEGGDEGTDADCSSDLPGNATPVGPGLFESSPCQVYDGHKSDVVCVAWSRSQFVLSASTDKTVRLWHISRSDCLCLFQHADFVTSVDFHPKEDSFFLSGSFDKKLRIWNIPEGRVVQWAQAPQMVTAACFNSTGSMAVAGLCDGQCIFYQSEGLRYYTQIECRNRRGPKSRGRKVSGLEFIPSNVSPTPQEHLLVTTNDSRIRLVNMGDYSTVCKYKGAVNNMMLIAGHCSEDGRHVVCGSEDKHVYLWRLRNDRVSSSLIGVGSGRRDKCSSYECFNAHASTVTSALFVPAAAVRVARGGAPPPAAVGSSTTESPREAVGLPHCMMVTSAYSGALHVFECR